MNSGIMKYVPFLFWIAFFAFEVGATLNSPRREGSGFKGVHSHVAQSSGTQALKLSKVTKNNGVAQ